MMGLKQKNKLTNVSVRSFVGGVLRNTENSVFTCTICWCKNDRFESGGRYRHAMTGSIPVESQGGKRRFDSFYSTAENRIAT
jgi:hypothetical protein